MRKVPQSLVFAGVLLLLVISVSGCTVGSGVSLYPQSHFDYPNSNIIPIGQVQAEVSGAVGLHPTIMDADLMEEVIMKALQQKGGDLLIDYNLSIRIKMYPLLIFNLYETVYRVNGTAAKMEVGKQILR